MIHRNTESMLEEEVREAAQNGNSKKPIAVLRITVRSGQPCWTMRIYKITATTATEPITVTPAPAAINKSMSLVVQGRAKRSGVKGWLLTRRYTVTNRPWPKPALGFGSRSVSSSPAMLTDIFDSVPS